MDHEQQITPTGASSQEHAFELPYDVLVVAVGAVNNTFNTPGVKENCFFLKVWWPCSRVAQALIVMSEPWCPAVPGSVLPAGG